MDEISHTSLHGWVINWEALIVHTNVVLFKTNINPVPISYSEARPALENKGSGEWDQRGHMPPTGSQRKGKTTQ